MIMLGIHIFIIGLFMVTSSTAKIGYFWHITDIHYDYHYSAKGDVRKNCWKTEKESLGTSRPNGRFGDYSCDSPWALVESAARAMKAKHGDNIEFVLWTGDGLSRNAIGRSSENQVEALKNLTNLLRNTFSSQFVFPVLGHDDPGSSPGERLTFGDLADYWKQWLPTEAIQTFKTGGYYTIERKKHKLRIIALNTNLYTSAYGPEDPQAQWAWLEGVLAKSHRNKETVYFVGHMGPGADERQPEAVPLFNERFARRYLRLVRKYSQIIVGQFFGHLHSDTFRLIYNEQGEPVSWMLMAPAVTPRQSTSGAINNPGLRLYKFDTDTGQVLDYTQYYLDLKIANQRDQADWQPEYNFSSYYEMNYLTAQSLHHLAQSFRHDPHSIMFNRYYRANSVGLDEGHCDTGCVHTHYCAITQIDYAQFTRCQEAAAAALASSGPRFTVATMASVLISAAPFIT
ncbi:acid sphingomyelinase-like phosphodiesterase 3b [Lycorma delicatula]|uniref:acid sphingomyelinase-like phosphodiesterase 3b n=1 Tax=Lycorma delicatula TaxID=130591 RepID=UPI003F516620